MQRLTDATRKHLKQYLADLKRGKKETAKREAFVALLGRLFPGEDVGRVAAGAEHTVRIDLGNRTKLGAIDTFHGNAVIEFELDLAATGQTARKQLREYVAGVWAAEPMPHRPLLAVATDGRRWETFGPTLIDPAKPKPAVADVILGEPLRAFTVKSTAAKEGDPLASFYFFLQHLLFRPQQVVPTAEVFAYDFGTGGELWGNARRLLGRAWDGCRDHPEAATAFDAWRRYLRYTYALAGGEAGLEDLFLRHTYLVSVARLLAWAALSGGKADKATVTGEDAARFILQGAYFRERGLRNIVDDDFFNWVHAPAAVDALAPLWEQALATLRGYDLSRLSQDVLKDVYEQLVNPQERHGLGEYYTPDWLCEAVVTQALPTDRVASTLDPSCGSGSFLRAAVAHYRSHVNFESRESELNAILSNVVGIDVHPLAVTVARVTYLLELRDLLAELGDAGRDIQLPVYLADALFMPAEVAQTDLYTPGDVTSGYEIRFGPRRPAPPTPPPMKGRKAAAPKGQPADLGSRVVTVPKSLVEAPRLFDPAIAAAADLARDLAAGSGDTPDSLRSFLQRRAPDLLAHPDAPAMLASVWDFATQLAELIKSEQDGIWAFVVRNAYRPAMLRGRFDFVVGNPPWLSYRYVADPLYQDEIRHRTVTQYDLLGGDKRSLFTQMELATVFLAHALVAFGSADARLAFVMPRAVLTADQHAALRERTYKPENLPIVLDGYWDLMKVRGLFNVPACVLFARKARPKWRAGSYELPAAVWKGNLPGGNLPWQTAGPLLTRTDKPGRLTFLGARSAFTTGPATATRGRPSVYLERFENGATLYPRNLYFVTVPDLGGGPANPDGLYRAFTDEDQARTAKAPWKEIRMSGRIDGRYLFAAPLAKHLLPFVLLTPPPVVLPYERGEHSAKMLSVKDLRDKGYRDTATWMAEATKYWEQHKPNNARDQSAADYLDHRRKLTMQVFKPSAWVVLYNASGTNLSACHVRADHFKLSLIVDHKMYWFAAKGEDEAAYLAAVLNSAYLDKAIKPFQATGLMGERDIHKKPLELPIPAYDAADGRHAALSGLGKRAASEAAATLTASDFPTDLAGRRRFVRQSLAEVRREIDRHVRPLLMPGGDL